MQIFRRFCSDTLYIFILNMRVWNILESFYGYFLRKSPDLHHVDLSTVK